MRCDGGQPQAPVCRSRRARQHLQCGGREDLAAKRQACTRFALLLKLAGKAVGAVRPGERDATSLALMARQPGLQPRIPGVPRSRVTPTGHHLPAGSPAAIEPGDRLQGKQQDACCTSLCATLCGTNTEFTSTTPHAAALGSEPGPRASSCLCGRSPRADARHRASGFEWSRGTPQQPGVPGGPGAGTGTPAAIVNPPRQVSTGAVPAAGQESADRRHSSTRT